MKSINNYVGRIAFLSFMLVSLFAVSSVFTFANTRDTKTAAKTSTKAAKSSRAAKRSEVTLAKARATALKRAPGKVESEELETEKGMRVYSFDIRNKKGTITEIWVSAKTGKIVHRSTENAKAEAKEKAADRKKSGKN